ncbi:MAG TPA: hypothetical protein VKU61_07990, partial [Candidatus Binatia bacterium]|nr:hypothetical protein [Candidatus Binatia bacterium]
CAPCGAGCAPCTNTIADLHAKITLKALKEAGQLKVKALLPLSGYTGEPLTVRLDDTDSTPIVQQAIGGLTGAGTKWQFKTKALGVQKVQLKRKQVGLWQLSLKTKGWFTDAAANDTAANTRFTVNVGTQCFTHPATAKIP